MNCADWKTADAGTRGAIVEALRRFASGPVGSPAGHGASLPDDTATQLFNSYCAKDLARNFKLYKLYTRAASFHAR